MKQIWFTSDHHFGHENIIGHCHRPFTGPGGKPDLEAMHRVLSERWNERVAPDDTVYYLGDFAMGPRELWPEYAENLHGRKILVRGNHDKGSEASLLEVGFAEVHSDIVVPLFA